MSTQTPERPGGTGVAPERVVLPGAWHLEFAHAAGRAASRFLVGLRDDQVLRASPCPSCRRILVPPRSFCEDCFVPTSDDWVDVGPEGVVESFTFTYARFAGYADPPYGVAYVRPDGATTAIANFVTGVDFSDPEAAAARLAIGTRMRAVFRPERQARITDFTWEPVNG
jgi:uncharacterized OB-fold protein